MLNRKTLDAKSQEKLTELLGRDPKGLNKAERKILEARRAYLTSDEKKYFKIKDTEESSATGTEEETGSGTESAEGEEENFEDLDENGKPIKKDKK